MTSFYQVLGVPRDAGFPQIKKAFRTRIKELHPDTKDDPDNQGDIHLLLEAYEVLSDPIKREQYDQSLGPGPAWYAPGTYHFNYREWLKNRPDEESQSKLLFYDLLRQRQEEALEVYGKLTSRRAFSLEKSLGREDFMDCGFMLAEEFEIRGDYSQALFLYLRLCELEEKRPYFRHFYVEVEDRLRMLLCQKITWEVGPRLLAEVLHQTLGFSFTQKTKAQLARKYAQVLESLGQGWEARKVLAKAISENPKDQGLKRLADQWAKGPQPQN